MSKKAHRRTSILKSKCRWAPGTEQNKRSLKNESIRITKKDPRKQLDRI